MAPSPPGTPSWRSRARAVNPSPTLAYRCVRTRHFVRAFGLGPSSFGRSHRCADRCGIAASSPFTYGDARERAPYVRPTTRCRAGAGLCALKARGCDRSVGYDGRALMLDFSLALHDRELVPTLAPIRGHEDLTFSDQRTAPVWTHVVPRSWERYTPLQVYTYTSPLRPSAIEETNSLPLGGAIRDQLRPRSSER